MDRQRMQIRILIALGLVLAAVLVGYNAFTSPPLSPAEPAAATAMFGAGYRLPVNTASAVELQQLPGVSETVAKAIITYRRQIVRFDSESDWMGISGVDRDLLAELLGYITFTDQ